MTTNIPIVDTHPVTEARPNYLNITRSFMSWAGTLDHKRVDVANGVGDALVRPSSPHDALALLQLCESHCSLLSRPTERS